MTKEAFYQLFIKELKQLYDAENQLVAILPECADAATSSELKEAILEHFEETKNQVQRLDKIFKLLKEKPEGEKCTALQSLISSARELIQSEQPSLVRDAGIISCAQQVEHFEISTYGTARTFARQLDFDEIADLLQETLDEEGSADKKLTDLAEGGIFSAGINQLAQEQ